MKKSFLLLLVVAVGVLAQTKPEVPRFAADEWLYLDTSDAMRFYYNKKPATGTGKTIRAWERVELRIDTIEGRKEQERISKMTTPAWEGNVVQVATYNVQIEYDCGKNEFRERRYIFYDAASSVIEALPDYDGYEWKRVNPKSVREALKKHACETSSPGRIS